MADTPIAPEGQAGDGTQAPGAAGVQAPVVSLPKGGGAIRGIGEKFAANPVTGTGSLTVPIATSPGRSGFGPQLSLTYDSGSGNGPFGFVCLSEWKSRTSPLWFCVARKSLCSRAM